MLRKPEDRTAVKAQLAELEHAIATTLSPKLTRLCNAEERDRLRTAYDLLNSVHNSLHRHLVS
jgi:nitrate reductase NapAB chaperone NapD